MGSAASTKTVCESLVFSGGINYDRIDDSTPYVSRRGVKMDFLDTFVSRCGGYHALAGLNSVEVLERFILPKTMTSTSSYCDYLYDDCGNTYVGEATVLISYAWQYKFLDVVAAMNNFFYDNKNVVVWFDIFSSNHHRQPLLSVEWLLGPFRGTVLCFSRVVLVMAPWHNPIPLNRLWCLWEIYCAVVGRTNSITLDIAMTKKGTKSFLKSVFTSMFDIHAIIDGVDINTADASNMDHVRAILSAVERSGGVAVVNASLRRVFRECLFTIALDLSMSISSDVAETDIWRAFSPAETKYKLPFDSLILDVFEILNDKGEYEEAVRLLSNELSIRQKLYGRTHCRTLNVRSLICRCWVSAQEYSLAFNCYKELLTLYAEGGGCREDDIIDILFQLAVLYQVQGNPKNAIPILRKVVKYKVAHLGESHEATIEALCYLASNYESLARWDVAHQSRRRVLDVLSGEYGDTHIRTAHAQGLLARSLTKANLHASSVEAASLYKRCVNTHLSVHAVANEETLTWMREYGLCLEELGRTEKAKKVYAGAWSGYMDLLGDDHPITQEVRALLDSVIDVTQHTGKVQTSTLCAKPKKGKHDRHNDLPQVELSSSPNKERRGEGSLREMELRVPVTQAAEIETSKQSNCVLLPALQRLDDISPMIDTLGVDIENAEHMYRKVLRIKRADLTDFHSSTLTSLHSLAVVVYASGRLVEAEMLFQEALRKKSHLLSPTHQSTLDSKWELANVLCDAGKIDRGVRLYREVINSRTTEQGEGHPSLLACKCTLAFLLSRTSSAAGDLEEAVELLESVYYERKAVLGEFDTSVLACISRLAEVMEKLGRIPESVTYYRKSVRVRRKLFGSDNIDTLISMQKFAMVLYQYHVNENDDTTKARAAAEAEQVLNEVIHKKTRILGSNHPSTLDALNCLSIVVDVD